MRKEQPNRRLSEESEADFQTCYREIPATYENYEACAHQHAFQEILFLEGGVATLNSDTERNELKGPLMVLMEQGKVHKFMPQPRSRLYLLRFTNEFLSHSVNDLFSQVTNFTSLPVHASALQYKITSLFRCMHQDFQQAEPNKVYPRHLLSALLAVLGFQLF